MIDAVTGSYQIMGETVEVTATCGYVVSDDRHSGASDLMRDASIALDAVRGAEKCLARRYDQALHEFVTRRHRLERELRHAIRLQQLAVVYQPVHCLRSGLPTSVEALMRWTHPELGPISPAEFISIAEATELVNELGAWLIKRAIADLAHWRAIDPVHCPSSLTINISRRQLSNVENLIGSVHDATVGHGVPITDIVLEITERDVVIANMNLLNALSRLRAKGARVAIDDFGVGQSSLSMLHGMPVDIVKIDKSFVDGLLSEPPQTTVISAVLSICEAFRLHCIAEGIERPAQVSSLLALGCRLGQGYHFSRPIHPSMVPHYFGAEPEDDITAQLAAG